MDAADLLVLGEDLVCPRCYALMAPAGAPSAPDEDAMAPPGAPAVAQAPARIEAAATHPGSDTTHPGPDMTHPPPDMARPGSRITGAWQRLERSIRAWATGRTWWVRAPLLVWFAWLLFRYWGDRTYQSIWHGINLGFHEAGHALFSYFGWLPMVLGGTLLEVAAPVAAGVVLYRQRDWFGVSVSLCWLGIVCFGVATYAGDAVARALPLVSPFGAEGATHDWANILGHFGALRHTATVAAAWEWGGRFFMTLGIVSGARILVIMRHETRAAGAVHGFHPS